MNGTVENLLFVLYKLSQSGVHINIERQKLIKQAEEAYPEAARRARERSS